MNLRVISDVQSAQELRESSIGKQIADAVSAVRAALGVGLPKEVYVGSLAEELKSRGLAASTDVGVPVVYGDRKFADAFTLDLVVEESVIVQAVMAEAITAAHEAQFQTYLKHADADFGFIVNFSMPAEQGVKCMARRR